MASTKMMRLMMVGETASMEVLLIDKYLGRPGSGRSFSLQEESVNGVYQLLLRLVDRGFDQGGCMHHCFQGLDVVIAELVCAVLQDSGHLGQFQGAVA